MMIDLVHLTPSIKKAITSDVLKKRRDQPQGVNSVKGKNKCIK